MSDKEMLERAEKYIEEHDHTTDVLGWEWDTNHVVAFAKQEIERERIRIMNEANRLAYEDGYLRPSDLEEACK